MRVKTEPRCQGFSEELVSSLDRPHELSSAAKEHIESCLRCQADLVQYRKLLRALHNLRAEVFEPAPGLLSEVFASLEAAGERHAVLAALHGRKVAYIGGIAAAAAATAAGAGALVLASRRARNLAS